ncbi:hypothetical protein HanXRQr2_Chr04g0181191 [Helianthus annuus]|uniref:Uncharacterized protein n=1 Tax=Helianthus annuus TaxID=4232 RepID=A0A251V149_HELAN|nr:hypothetical protein HanXRQr2_Chr04g0181191 [Helianthus annuus]
MGRPNQDTIRPKLLLIPTGLPSNSLHLIGHRLLVPFPPSLGLSSGSQGPTRGPITAITQPHPTVMQPRPT